MKTIIKISSVAVLIASFYYIQAASAAGPKVAEQGNKHNLSAWARQVGTSTLEANTNTFRAVNDPANNPGGQQVCIFCHTPHNANSEKGTPLWNRAFSTVTFDRYTSTTMRIYRDATTRAAAQYEATWQPDGASKLCLSCHDGVSNLGAVLSGNGGNPISMQGSNVINTIAAFTSDKMKKGHHPVSFVYDATVLTNIQAGGGTKSSYTLPTLVPEVKLDKNKKMQCTSCHNPHQNQSFETVYPATTRKIAPFWVKGGGADATTDHDVVCTACHPISALPEQQTPWQ